jgi:hypothetical protein
MLLSLFGMNQNSYAQSGPVLYFCEKYDATLGEIGISDRFTTGYLTVMVKCNYALGLDDVTIQFDKWNPSEKKFEFYKDFKYNVEPDMKYIYFAKNSESDMQFDTPGIYRVFLLDCSRSTVASALIEIIP